MIQCFSTIETWMRILHGCLKRLKNQNVIKETLLLSTHKVNAIELKVIKKWQPLYSQSRGPVLKTTG